MKVLFVHQNFPAQFKFLAPALVAEGYDVAAMMSGKSEKSEWRGVKLIPYSISRGITPNIHPWVSDFEAKAIRAEACFWTALKIKEAGFTPDVIVAHHGWGESLFLKEIWPTAKLGIYCEFFYHPSGADFGFDPEFPLKNQGDLCRLRLKNLTNILHFDFAEAGISPTHWQASTFPKPFRDKISVIHDGIDTGSLRPNSSAQIVINGDLKLKKTDEVITFVNRNFEPYRGYHIFMRALPEILIRRPKARVLLVGGDNVSYGAKPDGNQSWRDIFIREVRPKISDTDWQRVHFLGPIPYPTFVCLLQVSRVHVYLTYPFVLSWSLLEAMSIGCSIVASDTAPLHEAIEHEKTGLLVNFFDVEGLARQICRLLADPDLSRQLGSNARNFAEQNYDLQAISLPAQINWIRSLLNST